MSRASTKAKMFAFSVAMQAKRGDLPREDVAEMRLLSEELLASRDPIRKAINEFVTAFELRPDKAKLHEMGTDLFETIRIDNLPDAPDADRRDIHG